MAITTGGDLGDANYPTKTVVTAFNPCLINYSTDISGGIRGVVFVWNTLTTKATSIFNNITPDATGKYYVDLQGAFKDLVQTNDSYYEDDYVYPNVLFPFSNIFAIDENIISEIAVAFDIFNSSGNRIDLTSYFYFNVLRGSTQIGNLPILYDYSPFNSEFKFLNESDEGVIIWGGYPCDIQADTFYNTHWHMYIDGLSIVAYTSPALSGNERGLRIFLTDATGNPFSILSSVGEHEVELVLGGLYTATTNVIYKGYACTDKAKYFRYLNSKGGNSYFLFEDHYQTEVERDNKDNINRRFDSLETASSRTVSLGNENSYALLVHHLATTKLENDLLQGLLLSPVIELYDAEKQTFNRVNLIGNDSDKLTSKTQNTNYNFTFDLGVKYNQSI